MNLVAAMIARNELGRYLEHSVAALLGFCDEVRVLDDGSTDGTGDYLAALDRVAVLLRPAARMADRPVIATFDHEGRARTELLEWAALAKPSHLIAVDADEIVTGGQQIRALLEDDRGRGVWSPIMEEVWAADRRGLWTREDARGPVQWARHPVPVIWRAGPGRQFTQMVNRALACGRTPVGVRGPAVAIPSASILHFGWSNKFERRARYERYVQADGGRFHANAHIESIMDDDSRVRLRRRYWPAGVDADGLLARIRCEDCAEAAAA